MGDKLENRDSGGEINQRFIITCHITEALRAAFYRNTIT